MISNRSKANPSESEKGIPPVHSGCLPAWESDDLPEPLPFSARNALRTIGPGAILLVGAIGMGEWIAGPLIVAQYGRSILWIATVAFVLQSFLNLEAVRYTLYTGEPIMTGFMRLRPGPGAWGTFYGFCAIGQLGAPAAAAACAGVLFAMMTGAMPDAHADKANLRWITIALVVITGLILVSGRKVERVLERMSWAMIIYIFGFLLVVNIAFVPAAAWGHTLGGFVQFGALPPDIDILLLAVFAALAGSGGVGNLAIASWFRDKGFGMGGKVGSIGGALLGDDVKLEPVGKTFPINDKNMGRWRTWWKYAVIDQSGLWMGGCLIGMFLMVNLSAVLFPEGGTEVSGVAAGVFQAGEMQKLWSGFWILALLNGFWILFSTHIANTDVLTRTVTDIAWAANKNVRKKSVGRLYGILLLGFTVIGCFATFIGDAKTLLMILGATAGPVTAIAAIQILRVNTTLLPKAIRPPMWRRVMLGLCALFYGAISVALIVRLIQNLGR
jgi:hypothetical protein